MSHKTLAPGIKALLLSFILCSCSLDTGSQRQVHAEPEPPRGIENILAGESPQALIEPLFMQRALMDVYSHRQFQPVWDDAGQRGQVISVLEASVEYGLLPQDYHLPAILALASQQHASSGPDIAATLDVLLSDGLLLYIHHRREGKVHPRDLYPEFNFERDHSADLQPTELIRQASHADNLSAFIDAQAPTASYYELLRRQLAIYREIAAAGGWPIIPAGSTLRTGDTDTRLDAVHRRLQVTGDLSSATGGEPEVFSEQLERAVMRFQSRHGLAADGVIGEQTLAALNTGVDSRIDQLRLSLERLRWLEHNSDREFIAVNIAGFRLAYVKDHSVAWTTRVVVGTPYRKTPVFRSLMTYLEFNPTWTIPPTILREDTLPAIRRNTAYLAERNISVIDRNGRKIDPSTIDWSRYKSTIPYTLRQEPGPANALGRVKFIFPNPYSVYMHDTPQQSLFAKPVRGFSSGCIRVENPFQLVELVLQGQRDFSSTELEKVLGGGQTRRVLLERPLPVMILYLTAAVDDTGKAMFYPDIYDRDPALLEILDGPVLPQSL